MERKTFKLSVDQFDEQLGTFEGYASVFGNIDEQGDIVDKGAFAKTIQENGKVPLIWQHKPQEPIGVALSLIEDSRGLKMQGQLNLDVMRGKEAYSLLKQGAIRGLSIGYDVVKKTADNGVRRLKEVRLWEISLVTFPANTQAVVVSVKEDSDDHSQAAVESPTDEKAGRSISAANRLLLQQAFDALQALLVVAEPPTEGTQSDIKPPEKEEEIPFGTLLQEMQTYVNTRRVL